jgi:moderate conductance mechanosensitive channel
MRTTVVQFLSSILILFFVAFPAQSQTSLVPQSLKSSEQTQTLTGAESFAEIMKQAAESGVRVIVVDTQGNPLSQPVDAGDAAAGSDTDSGMSNLMSLQMSAVEFRKTLFKRLQALPGSFEEVNFILKANSPTGELWAYVEALLWSLAFFAIGYVFEKQVYGKRFVVKFFELRTKEEPIGYSEKLPFLVSRFFLRAIGVLISMAVAYIIGATFIGPLDNSAMQFTVTLINIAYAGCRLTTLLWRMVLAPYACQYRISQFSNKDASRLYHWLWISASVAICAEIFGAWVNELGLTYDVFALITAVLTTLVVFMNIALILVNRKPISRAIRNGAEPKDAGKLGLFVSTAWASIAIIYLVFAWADLTYRLVLEIPLSMPLVLGAYAILVSIIVVYAIINYLIERFFRRTAAMEEINKALQAQEEASSDDDTSSTQEDAKPAPYEHPLSNFEDLARRVAGILAFVAGLWALMSIWDIGNRMTGSSAFIQRSLDIIVIIFIGYIVYHIFRIWIDSKIKDEGGDDIEMTPGDEGGASGASRLATLLPLFRNFILVVVVVTIALIALLQIGINVSPLFAGAGVAGLAIGFGAQTLVRDIFSGAFFLVDDAFRKGEYIDVGSVRGTVEKISVRSFQLRHHLGPLHTIPFGEIQVLTNYSRDWVMMKLPLRVTYDTDVEKVRKLIKKLGLELMEDPVIGENFLQPLKSQGVIEMQDSAMIIRVKFMTKPGDQWVIRKRVFQEIRDLFAREGIKFAHREVTVRLADDNPSRELTPAQKTAIAGAALSGLEEDAQAGGANQGDDREE